MERAPQYRTRFDAVYEYSKAVFVNSRRYIGAVYRTISTVTLLVMFLVASHASAAITPAEIFLTVINKPYVAPSCVDSDDTCDFTVSVSVGSKTYYPTQEYSYAWGYPGAPLQLSTMGTNWTSQYLNDNGVLADGKTFNYLQTSNFDGYVKTSTPKPTTVSVTDKTGKATSMRLSYGMQYRDGTGGQGSTLPWVFEVGSLSTIGDDSDVVPYHFTIHAFDGDEHRELAVWLSSKYDDSTYINVSTLFSQGHRNQWIEVGNSHIAYVGGLYNYAVEHSGGFKLNLDMDLDGSLMNLSTSYVLYHVDGGGSAKTCAEKPNSCTLARIGKHAAVVTGPIVIAGSGRINGFSLLSEDLGTLGGLPQEEYLINSGLIELSSSHGTYDDFTKGAAIDVAGITVAFSPKRRDSSVFLNNQYRRMCTILDAVKNMCPADRNNNKPVKVFDFKMVGNWVDAADGLEVQGDGSELTFTYLHVADDSMKVAAKNMQYKHTTILQGDVSAGGMINLGSYGTADSQGSYVEGVYVHRITQKPSTSTRCPQGETGNCGAALVAAPTCRFGRSVTDITVNKLQVNDLGNNINSVNRPFNIGLGTSNGFQKSGCNDGNPLAIETNITKLTFTNFGIYTGALANSTFYYRFTGPVNSEINNINFFDGKVNTNVANKVAIYSNSTTALFICGVGGDAVPGLPIANCWGNQGMGMGTKNNVSYSSSNFNFGTIYPYTTPTP